MSIAVRGILLPNSMDFMVKVVGRAVDDMYSDAVAS